MAQDKRFSVITPLYKDGYKTLDKFLLHLDEQDYKNFEVIFVYNSPDNEAKKAVKKIRQTKIAKRMKIKEVDAGYDPKLKMGNHCRAFNVGVDNSTGDYLVFHDPEIYFYPGILREYKDAFEKSGADFVYGDYDFENGGGRVTGRPYDEYQLKCANYISGAFPIKREAFKGWDPEIQSLQDWDMRLSAVEAGAKGYYIERPCFITEMPKDGGISHHSATHWLESYNKVRNKHQLPLSKTVVTSLGAPQHATNTAKILGCDVRVLSNVPNFKPHEYENMYLLGFYPLGWQQHMSLFYELGDTKNELVYKKRIIHWIGTDIYQMQTKLNWMAWKNITGFLNHNDFNFTHLSECEATQKELEELGIKSEIVPLPAKEVYDLCEFPIEFTIGVYINPTQDMYFEDFMYDLADSMPDIKFKFFGNPAMKDKVEGNKEWVGYVDMRDFLPTVSAIVRLTRHDGLPMGPAEAMMMGRNCLTSLRMPHALHTEVNGVPDKADVIEKIRQLQTMPLNEEGSKYWKEELSKEKYLERMAKYEL